MIAEHQLRPVTAVAAGGLASALAVLTLADPAEARQVYYAPVTHTWTIIGHGYGHGHGMSQYGAQGAALRGLGYRKILHFYYPRTTWSKTAGPVRVLISADSTSDVQVVPRSGLYVRDLTDHAKYPLPTNLRATRWRLRPIAHGRTAVQYDTGARWHRWSVPGHKTGLSGVAEFRAAGPIALLVPSGGDLVPRRYRGALRSAPPYPGARTRDTVNVVSLNSYVRGVVAWEMPSGWAEPALKAQAVAARTYAVWLRRQNPHRYVQACDTTACQVYGGVAAESARSDRAVSGTAGQILTYRHRPAFTQFSSSSGGWTSYGGTPYLPAKKDPYDGWSGNPMHTWTVTVSTASLQRAFPGLGRLVDLRVTAREGHGRWGGRVSRIVLDGARGRASMTGDRFRSMYALRSTWFTIAPTPIMARWYRLGGPRAAIGRPTSGEQAVGDGARQVFRHGRIFWSATTGAHDLAGALLATYRKWGGPRSSLGWPVTGPRVAAHGGHKSLFQRGVIFSRPGLGAHVVYGAILRYWRRHGAASSWIGYPTANTARTSRGTICRFQRAVLTWDKKTNTVTVRKTG